MFACVHLSVAVFAVSAHYSRKKDRRKFPAFMNNYSMKYRMNNCKWQGPTNCKHFGVRM